MTNVWIGEIRARFMTTVWFRKCHAATVLKKSSSEPVKRYVTMTEVSLDKSDIVVTWRNALFGDVRHIGCQWHWPWPWPWFIQHHRCIEPHVDATNFCLELMLQPLPRLIPFFGGPSLVGDEYSNNAWQIISKLWTFWNMLLYVWDEGAFICWVCCASTNLVILTRSLTITICELRTLE